MMEMKSDSPFEDWRLSKIVREFLLHGKQSVTIKKAKHWFKLREIIAVLDENRTKHINRAVWKTAEFTLEQMVRIVTTWLKRLILVAEAIFIENVLQCDTI